MFVCIKVSLLFARSLFLSVTCWHQTKQIYIYNSFNNLRLYTHKTTGYDNTSLKAPGVKQWLQHWRTVLDEMSFTFIGPLSPGDCFLDWRLCGDATSTSRSLHLHGTRLRRPRLGAICKVTVRPPWCSLSIQLIVFSSKTRNKWQCVPNNGDRWRD